MKRLGYEHPFSGSSILILLMIFKIIIDDNISINVENIILQGSITPPPIDEHFLRRNLDFLRARCCSQAYQLNSTVRANSIYYGQNLVHRCISAPSSPPPRLPPLLTPLRPHLPRLRPDSGPTPARLRPESGLFQ